MTFNIVSEKIAKNFFLSDEASAKGWTKCYHMPSIKLRAGREDGQTKYSIHLQRYSTRISDVTNGPGAKVVMILQHQV